MRGRIGPRGGIWWARIYRGLTEIRSVLRSRLVGRSFKESHRLRARSRSRNSEQAAGCGVTARQGRSTIEAYNVYMPSYIQVVISGLNSRIRFCIVEGSASVYTAMAIYALTCINNILINCMH